MSSKSDAQFQGGGGVGFVGLLTLLFIALKLTGVITWTWWWVLSPLWISALTVLVIFVVVIIVLAVKATKSEVHRRR